MSRDVWAIVSDLHCGSTLGLVPERGVRLDDGGWYQPTFYQTALWDCWKSYWAEVKATLKRGDRLILEINGDALDGDHHKTGQIISKNLAATQHEIAETVLAPALELEPKAIHVVRGTEVHVGSSAEYEERLARSIGAEQHPRTGAYSRWHLQAISQDVFMDFAHHGAVGKLPHTRSNPAKTLAMKIAHAAFKKKVRAPDVVYRSHCHQGADTGEEMPVRVIQTRGWQLSTAFVERIAAGSLPEIGGIIQVNEAGQRTIRKVDFEWERDEPWTL